VGTRSAFRESVLQYMSVHKFKTPNFPLAPAASRRPQPHDSIRGWLSVVAFGRGGGSVHREIPLGCRNRVEQEIGCGRAVSCSGRYRGNCFLLEEEFGRFGEG
jgi:hypothetical protein